MFDTKLTFTLYDLIGHVVPGSFALLVTAWAFHFSVPANNFLTTTVFLILSYVIGHLLHALGSWLVQNIWWIPRPVEKVMDQFFKNARSFLLLETPPTAPNIKEKIRSELVRVGFSPKGEKIDDLALYDYCANILLEVGCTGEKDVLESKEAFYRSLIPTIIYSAIILSLYPPIPFFQNRLLVAIITILLLELCLSRRELYRRIRNNQIYKLALFKLKARKEK